jgi:ABC-type nitrate/sulfonate/bicarbonate transport system substrate-binding protein
MKHLLTAIIIVLVAVLLAILIVPMVKYAQPVDVTIAVEPSLSAASITYAEAKSSIFPSQDVKVKAKIIVMDNPQQAFDDLNQGKINFALMPWPEALRWMDEHPKDTLRCILSEEFKVGSPQDGIFARKGVKLDKITDLEGKKIGVSALTELPMKAIIGSAQLDSSKITIKLYPKDKLIPALESGEVDLIYALEPYFTEALEKFGKPYDDGAMMPKWIKAPYWGSGLFITPKYLKEHKLAVVRVNMGMEMTYDRIGKESDSARIFVAKVLGISDPNVVSNVNLTEIVRAQDMDVSTVQDLSDKYEIYGVLKSINISERKILVPREDLRQ